MDKRLMRDSTSCTSMNHGKAFCELIMIEVELDSGKHIVRALFENEAKAEIAEEYGFEYNSIRIEDVCWYEATDMNYFRFSVRGDHYEVHDFGTPQPVDPGAPGMPFTDVPDLGPHIITIEVSGGMVQNVYTTLKTGVEVDILDFDDNGSLSDEERNDMQNDLERAVSEQRQIY